MCRPRQNHRLENGLGEPRPDDFSRRRRRVSLHLGQAPARRVCVPHTRVARVFASPSRAKSSSAPSVTVTRAACATLRLCGALVSERARAGGAGIVCLAMFALFVDVAGGRKSRTNCVKVVSVNVRLLYNLKVLELQIEDSLVLSHFSARAQTHVFLSPANFTSPRSLASHSQAHVSCA